MLIAAAAGGCSSDVLHSTAWQTRCDAEPNALECGGTPASSSGAGGEGGSGGEPSAGGGGDMGGSTATEVGGGGTGGDAPCQTCSEVAMGMDPSIPACRGSQPEIDALIACICAVCMLECEMECAGGQPTGGEVCNQCVQAMGAAGCPQELQACLADSG
jgi:hypothetical protein